MKALRLNMIIDYQALSLVGNRMVYICPSVTYRLVGHVAEGDKYKLTLSRRNIKDSVAVQFNHLGFKITDPSVMSPPAMAGLTTGIFLREHGIDGDYFMRIVKVSK